MSSDAMPDRSAMAAELALGLLEGTQRAAALRLVLSDPSFAAEVEAWRTQLAPLYDGFAPVAPPVGLMVRIDQLIDSEASSDQMVVPAARQPAVTRWKMATFAASAVAALLALALVWPAPQPDPLSAGREADAAMAVAQLTGPIDGLLLTARYDSGTAEMLVRVEGMPVTDTEPELWIVPADGQPRRLGRLLRGGVTRIDVPEGHRKFIDPVSELILTMEPKVMPDPNHPSAPAVAQGRLQRI